MASHFVVFGKKNVIEHLFVGLLGVRVGRGFEGIWVEMEGDGGGFGMIFFGLCIEVGVGGACGKPVFLADRYTPRVLYK